LRTTEIPFHVGFGDNESRTAQPGMMECVSHVKGVAEACTVGMREMHSVVVSCLLMACIEQGIFLGLHHTNII